MSQKAIFIDVDGTLLNEKHQITKLAYLAIQKLINQDFLVVLATARPPEAVFFIAEKLGLQTAPVICCNGALIVQQEEVIQEQGVSSSVALNILAMKPLGVTLNFYKNKDWFVNEVNEHVEKEMKIVGVKPKEKNIIDLLKIWEKTGELIHKVLAIGNPSAIAKWYEKINEVSLAELNIHLSKPGYLEMTHRFASKKNAMFYIMDQWNIFPANSFAIGDGHNDQEMIAAAAFGIAMGNAPEDVKSIADFVTNSNQEEGFARAVRRVLNGKI